MEEKMSGIVLGGVNFGENDKILNVFTLEQGVVSAKIKGVKKAGAKLKFASEPFCFAEFIFMKKGNLRTVIGASLLDSFYPVREDIFRYFCAGSVVEFIKKFYREEIVSKETFMFAVNALKQIAYGDNPRSSLIEFLLHALKPAGYALYLNACAACEGKIESQVFFDYRRGAFFCKECFDGVGREIMLITYDALCLADKGQLFDGFEGVNKALSLIDYYLQKRTDESINSLSELVKLCG